MRRLNRCTRACRRVLPSIALITAGTGTVFHASAAPFRNPEAAAVSSAHPLATKAGLDVLAGGGNAFDAAVTVASVLAVVEPYSSGLGGGGFWLLHDACTGRDHMIDSREVAASESHASMYQDAAGKAIAARSINGALAAGIPGVPAALDFLARTYATRPLADLLAPAIHLARFGFPVTPHYRFAATARLDALLAGGDAATIFLHGGKVPLLGETIIQRDLAVTLERLGVKGADGFYAGPTAADLVIGVRNVGGNWHLKDLTGYKIRMRQPLVGHFHGMRVTTVPPPSAGGITLIEALNILSTFPLQKARGADRTHLLIEAMRRAYADRARYLGDPDYVDVPVNYLLSHAHARHQRLNLRRDRATPSARLNVPNAAPSEGRHTTHFSILDTEGNLVSATLSINYLFGSGYVPPGTGVLLNDEMDDFAASQGDSNLYGLVGSAANAIAPGKRPLSSMTPTFLKLSDRLGVLGTPGGSRIPSMVLLAALDFIDGQIPSRWVSKLRLHHQYLPDRVEFEPGALTELERYELQQRGHDLQETTGSYGNMQVLLWNHKTGQVSGASDPRGEGSFQTVATSGARKLAGKTSCDITVGHK